MCNRQLTPFILTVFPVAPDLTRCLNDVEMHSFGSFFSPLGDQNATFRVVTVSPNVFLMNEAREIAIDFVTTALGVVDKLLRY